MSEKVAPIGKRRMADAASWLNANVANRRPRGVIIMLDYGPSDIEWDWFGELGAFNIAGLALRLQQFALEADPPESCAPSGS